MFHQLRRRWSLALGTPTEQDSNTNTNFSSPSRQTTPTVQSDFESNEVDENSCVPQSIEKNAFSRLTFSPVQKNKSMDRSLRSVDTTNRSDQNDSRQRIELSESSHDNECKENNLSFDRSTSNFSPWHSDSSTDFDVFAATRQGNERTDNKCSRNSSFQYYSPTLDASHGNRNGDPMGIRSTDVNRFILEMESEPRNYNGSGNFLSGLDKKPIMTQVLTTIDDQKEVRVMNHCKEVDDLGANQHKKGTLLPAREPPTTEYNEEGFPDIEFSQSLPSTVDEMIDPTIALSYRMRGIPDASQEESQLKNVNNKYLDGGELENESFRENSDASANNHGSSEDHQNYTEVLTSEYVSGENPLSRYRFTPSDQKWFSPRKYCPNQINQSPTPSPPQISASQSLPSPEDSEPLSGSKKLASRRGPSCRRGSGGTPISSGVRTHGKSRKSRHQKEGTIDASAAFTDSPAQLKSKATSSRQDDVCEVKYLDSQLQQVKIAYLQKSSQQEPNESHNPSNSPVQGQLSKFKPSPLALRRVFASASVTNQDKPVHSSTDNRVPRNESNQLQSNTSVCNVNSGYNMEGDKHSSSDSDDESEDKKQQRRLRDDGRDTTTSNDEDYTWAYEVWRRKGLLQDGRPSPAKVVMDDPKPKENQETFLADNTKKKTYNPQEWLEDSVCNKGYSRKPACKIKERKSLPIMSVYMAKHAEDNNKAAFASILNRWRLVSDDKPCSHFLSPESQRSHFGKTKTENDSIALKLGQRDGRSFSQDRVRLSDTNHSDMNRDTTATEKSISKYYGVLESSKPSKTPASCTHESDISKVMVESKSLDKIPSGVQTATQEKKPNIETTQPLSKTISSNVSLMQRSRMRTPKSRKDFKTVVREFLKDTETEHEKARSKSVPPLYRKKMAIPVSNSESPEEILKALVRPTISVVVSANKNISESEARRSQRSKSLPRLRENSQMAESLTNLRPKLTKEYSNDQSQIMPIDEIQVKTRSRRVLDLLDKSKNSTNSLMDSDKEPMASPINATNYCVLLQSLDEPNDSLHVYQPCKDSSPKSHISERTKNTDDGSHTTQTSRHVESVRKSFEICRCSSSLFSGNNELVEFYLPLTGTACGCGQRQPGLRRPDEPSSLANILRPWQVEFLGSYGIFLGDQLVKAHHRSARDLANALYRYRKRNNMRIFDVKTCSSALKVRTAVHFFESDNIARLNSQTFLPSFVYTRSGRRLARHLCDQFVLRSLLECYRRSLCFQILFRLQLLSSNVG
jgi:hypothetical protein